LGLSEDSFLSLYKTLVRPILEYGNLVWGPNYKGDICKLEKIQQKATRMHSSKSCGPDNIQARTQQKLVLLKLEEFTLESRGNNVSLGQDCFF